MEQPSPVLEKLAPWTVRAAAVWILVVSSIKAFGGSPNDIPLFLRQWVGPELAYFGSISIEMAFAAAALVRPRWGWMMMSALMLVFVGVLLHLISIGATSCGCFGGAIKLAPAHMLVIDGGLFLAMLATRPWKSRAGGNAPPIATVAVAAIGALVPWFVISNDAPPAPKPVYHAPDETRPADTNVAVNAQSSAPAAVEGSVAAQPAPEVNDSTPRVWTLPTQLPRWVKLEPETWVGQSIHDTELGVWMDTRSFSGDGSWILYLETCEHCRDFLQKLDEQFAADPKIYVFVRLSTPDDESAGIVKIKPPGDQAALPSEVNWVLMPEAAPWEIVLEGGVVKSAHHRGD